MPWAAQWEGHSILRLARCFGAFFNKLLEQNQGYCVLVSSVRGRRSSITLMVASTLYRSHCYCVLVRGGYVQPIFDRSAAFSPHSLDTPTVETV